jgi:hypothetical protein
MKGIIGGILLAMGILIAGASGLCSLAILVDTGEYGGASMLPVVLLVGGIPFAVGVLLLLGGRVLLRQDRAERAKATATAEPAEGE